MARSTPAGDAAHAPVGLGRSSQETHAARTLLSHFAIAALGDHVGYFAETWQRRPLVAGRLRFARDPSPAEDRSPSMSLLFAAIGATRRRPRRSHTHAVFAVGDAPTTPRPRSGGVIWTIAAGSTAGSPGPSSEDSRSTRSLSRPLGVSAFALLIAVGARAPHRAAVSPPAARRADRRRPAPEPRLLGAVLLRLTPPSQPGHRSQIRAPVMPGAIYDGSSALFLGPLVVPPRPARRDRTGRLVRAGDDARRRPARPAVAPALPRLRVRGRPRRGRALRRASSPSRSAERRPYTALAATTRTVLEPLPSTRGLVFDRHGRPLVTNVASYSVQDPARRPAGVAPRRGHRHARRPDRRGPADINSRSTRTRVRASTSFASPRTSIRRSRASSRKRRTTCPASRSSSRRGGSTRPARSSPTSSATPARSAADELPDPRDNGYLPDDLIGRAASSRRYEQQLRGTYGLQAVERDAIGPRDPGPAHGVAAASRAARSS